jgi:hypothetical protein
MKKYIIPFAALVLIAGAVNAQTAVKKTDNPATKMSKPVAKKPSTTTATVSPSTPATATTDKKTGAAAIQRKQHKKSKSVKPVSK